VRLRIPVSLRIAWDIIRAWTPTVWSPICPSSSARGVSAATESTAITSTAPERTSMSTDLERLLAVVGLRDQQLVDVDADLLRVQRVHRVLGIHERTHAAELLGLGKDVVHERRLARRLRPKISTTRPRGTPPIPSGDVQRQRAGGDRVYGDARTGSPIRMTVPLPNCFSICERAPAGLPGAWRRASRQGPRRLSLARSCSVGSLFPNALNPPRYEWCRDGTGR